jgi:mannosyltransferase
MPSHTSTLRDAIYALAILSLAALVRLYGIANESLWLDEAYSWWDAREPLGALWHLAPQCDPHPPLYALLLKAWVELTGDGRVALRGFSTVLGILTTAVVMLAGRQIDARVGWISGILFAVTPFQIEFAQEARPYTLLALGAALLLYGLLEVSRSPVPRLWPGWIALLFGGIITLWSNSTSMLTIAAAAFTLIAIMWKESRVRALWRPALIVVALIAVSWLPYLPIFIEQARGVSDDFWIPRPDLWRVFNELRFVVGFGYFEALWFLFPLSILGLTLLCREGKRAFAWILFAMFVLPVVFNLSVSLLVKPIYLARTLIVIAPAFALAIAVAIAGIRRASLRHAALAVYVCVCMWNAAQTLYWKEGRKEQWLEVARTLVHSVKGDTLVLVVPNELALPLSHAFAEIGATLPIRGAPADFPAPGLLARYPSGKCSPSIVGQDLSALLDEARHKETLFFITRTGNVYDPRDEIRPRLEALGLTAESVQRFRAGSIEVHRYEQRNLSKPAN